MKKFILFLSMFLVSLLSGFLGFNSQSADGYDVGDSITCYSTFTNSSFGGTSTVDCVDCTRVRNVSDLKDRGSCTTN